MHSKTTKQVLCIKPGCGRFCKSNDVYCPSHELEMNVVNPYQSPAPAIAGAILACMGAIAAIIILMHAILS